MYRFKVERERGDVLVEKCGQKLTNESYHIDQID